MPIPLTVSEPQTSRLPKGRPPGPKGETLTVRALADIGTISQDADVGVVRVSGGRLGELGGRGRVREERHHRGGRGPAVTDMPVTDGVFGAEHRERPLPSIPERKATAGGFRQLSYGSVIRSVRGPGGSRR